MYSCTFCAGFLGHSFKKLLRHIKFIHSHEPNFSITCGDCGQSFRKFNSFKTHIRREQAKKKLEQRFIVEEASDTEVDEHQGYESDGEQGPEEEQSADSHVGDITKFLALFILKTKEENQLSQQSIDSILANTEDVVETSLQYLKDKISNCLADSNIQIEDVNGLADVFKEPCVFSRAKEPLANEYLQVKYFLENFDLVVRTRSHVSFILCVFLCHHVCHNDICNLHI